MYPVGVSRNQLEFTSLNPGIQTEPIKLVFDF